MLEIIATTLEDAKLINKSGADRIELVSSLSEGGLTPSYGLIKSVVNSVNIPVNVMIRPHSQSFVYTDDEISLMIEDIKIAKLLGANGIVIGVLNTNNEIDIINLKKLLEVTDGLEVTFHRAIDECSSAINEIKKISNFNKITKVLSSGGKGKAEDNLNVIKEMNKYKNILAASGITISNFKYIMNETNVKEIHVGTSVRYKNSSDESIDIIKLNDLVIEYRNLQF